MPREKQRRGEKPQWRKQMHSFVARVWEVDGSGSGWQSLGTDDYEVAKDRYRRWLESGVPPEVKHGRRLFRDAAEDVIAKQEKTGAITARLARDRRKRIATYALPVLGHLDIQSVREDHVASALDAMAAAGKAAGYLLKLRSDLSQIFAALKRSALVKANVARAVSLPPEAKADTRERVSLTDEQLLKFHERRGFREPLDLMVLLCRWVAAHRTSDIHAALWQDCDQGEFSWIKVRRPKTDGQVGQSVRAGRRPVRAYEKVEHEIDVGIRKHIRAYWQSVGQPKAGPLFPLLRDGTTGVVKDESGAVLYERRGSKAGGQKAPGSSYAKPLRQAVWECEIYDPREGFDPENPQKELCRLQTDTEESRRLDFHSLRRDLSTALSDAGVNDSTAMAITGHTQTSTRLKHYMGRRRVAVPPAALPGGKVESALSPEVLAALAVLQRAAGGAGGRAESREVSQTSRDFGRNPRSTGSHSASNSPEPLASPRGIEPLTNALGTHGSARGESQPVRKTRPRRPSGPALDPVSSHGVGENPDPFAALRMAAATAVAAGDWALADRIRALIEAGDHPGVTKLSDARKRRR